MDKLALCSNWEQVRAELDLRDEDISDEKTMRRLLRLTYPIERVNDTDTYSLVRDIERKGRYTPIDDGVLDIVIHLNRIGIRTLYCCEGHVTDRHPAPFWGNLMYETPELLPDKMEEALRVLESDGFLVENDVCNGVRRTNIRWKFSVPEEKENKLQLLKSLLEVCQRYRLTRLDFFKS